MYLSSTKQKLTQAWLATIQFARRRQAMLLILLLLFPLLVEAGRMTWAWLKVNDAVRHVLRYGVTGQYDSSYCDNDCGTPTLQNAARLKTIYTIAQEEMSSVWDQRQFPDALDVTVCSNHPGYFYNDQSHICLPHEDTGTGGDQILVSIAYDYPLGAGWGAGLSALQMRDTRSGIVESFRTARAIDVPPVLDDLAMNSQSANGDRLVVITGDLQLVVPEVESSLEQIAAMAQEADGYVLNSSTDSADGQQLAEITIRVPADQFNTLLGHIKKLGSQVLRENIQGNDVTEEYVDLEGRLKGLQATLAQLDSLLKESKTVEEALQVSVERGKVQEQIEQTLGRKQYLENQAALATLNISLSTTPPRPERSPLAWQPSTTVENASRFLVALGYFLGDLAIWALIVGLPIALTVWIIVQIIRRTRRKV